MEYTGIYEFQWEFAHEVYWESVYEVFWKFGMKCVLKNLIQSERRPVLTSMNSEMNNSTTFVNTEVIEGTRNLSSYLN